MATDAATPGSKPWNLLLSQEADDAAALFTHGLRITQEIRHDYNDAASAMSLLALGAEKMLKLTIGLARLSRSQPWPGRNYMHRLGHKIVIADKRARRMLDLRCGTVPGHMQERAAKIDSDNVIALALPALERFADQGRFYFLDSLGEDPQTEAAPHSLWTSMVEDVMLANPQLRPMSGESASLDMSRSQVNLVIVASLRDWWEFYRVAWMTGVNGPLAKELSSAIRLLSH
jgi:hypothetical protein